MTYSYIYIKICDWTFPNLCYLVWGFLPFFLFSAVGSFLSHIANRTHYYLFNKNLCWYYYVLETTYNFVCVCLFSPQVTLNFDYSILWMPSVVCFGSWLCLVFYFRYTLPLFLLYIQNIQMLYRLTLYKSKCLHTWKLHVLVLMKFVY